MQERGTILRFLHLTNYCEGWKLHLQTPSKGYMPLFSRTSENFKHETVFREKGRMGGCVLTLSGSPSPSRVPYPAEPCKLLLDIVCTWRDLSQISRTSAILSCLREAEIQIEHSITLSYKMYVANLCFCQRPNGTCEMSRVRWPGKVLTKNKLSRVVTDAKSSTCIEMLGYR